MILTLPWELIKNITDYLDTDTLYILYETFPNLQNFLIQYYKLIPQYPKIINSISNNKNIFITGPGGCGKSYILKTLTKKYSDIYVTASTGVSAININGRTLHSFMGIGIDFLKKDIDLIIKRIKRYNKHKDIIKCKKLIIDEISMIGGQFFEKLNILCKRIRKNYKPFGGIQLIVSGDFLQLPPINDDWIFQTSIWKELEFKIIELTIPYRFTDNDYWKMLQRIRMGNLYKNDHLKLKQCLNKQITHSTIKPTILYPLKINVELKNKNEMNMLNTNEINYKSIDTVLLNKNNNTKKSLDIIFDNLAPKNIILKLNAQVMLKRNINIESGLCNGSRGIITQLHPNYVVVKFLNGLEIPIERQRYEYSNQNDSLILVREQIPLILAWALTVHSCQGSTIDYCEIDIGNAIFEDGQAYVALSRVKNWDGLYLKQYCYKSIKANQTAKDFYENIK